MSIIADTLNRLQARPSSMQLRQPEAFPRSGHQHDGHSPPHDSSMPSKRFILVALGLATGIGSLGAVGFWIGWNLDLGPSVIRTSSLIREERPIALASPGSTPEADQPLAPHSLTEISVAHTKTIPLVPPPPPSDSSSVSTRPDQVDNPISEAALTSLTQTPAPVNTQEVSPSKRSSTRSELRNSSHRHPVKELAAIPMVSPVSQASASEPSTPGQPEAETVDITHPMENAKPIQKRPGSSFTVKTPMQETPTDHSLTAEPATTVLLEEKIVEDTFPANQTLETTQDLPPQAAERLSVTDSPPQVTQTRTSSQVLRENSLRQGQYLIREGQYKEALTVLSTLFENPPEDWEPWFWMGTAYLGNGNLEQADQYFLSGLARNDKVPHMWIQRALVAQQRGEYQLAIHELRHAESLQPELPHLHLNMGYAYDQLGNQRLANQYYGRFMQLSEGNPDFFPTREKILDRLTQPRPSNNP